MNYINTTQPIFIQIADQICDRILNKYYLPNERSPSVRELAAEMQVNPNTVMRSYERLQYNGIMFNRRGIGYFFSSEAKEIIIKIRNKYFIEEILPTFFKEMVTLNVNLDDFIKAYNTYIKLNHETK